MKGLIVTKDLRPELAGDIEMPRMGDYNALVKTECCCICNGIDRVIIAGALPEAGRYLLFLGHEAVGRVVALGLKAQHLRVGDRAYLRGDGFQGQPFQASAFSKLRLQILNGLGTGAAIKACGTGCRDDGMAAGRQPGVDVQHVAAHNAARWVNQHMVANGVAFRVEALQHAQWAVMAVVGNGACTIESVIQSQVAVPAHVAHSPDDRRVNRQQCDQCKAG